MLQANEGWYKLHLCNGEGGPIGSSGSGGRSWGATAPPELPLGEREDRQDGHPLQTYTRSRARDYDGVPRTLRPRLRLGGFVKNVARDAGVHRSSRRSTRQCARLALELVSGIFPRRISANQSLDCSLAHPLLAAPYDGMLAAAAVPNVGDLTLWPAAEGPTTVGLRCRGGCAHSKLGSIADVIRGLVTFPLLAWSSGEDAPRPPWRGR